MDLMDFYDVCKSNKIYCELQSKLLHMISKDVPAKRLTNREGKKKSKSWINKSNLKHLKEKKQNISSIKKICII